MCLSYICEQHTIHTQTLYTHQTMCDVRYSPFLQCGGEACVRINGKNVCAFHVYQLRKHEDCSVCLDTMCMNDTQVIVLACGHMFHTKCLQHLKDPVCPLCRKQMTCVEAAYIFKATVIEPLAIQLYSLSPATITCVLQAFDMILFLGRCAHENLVFAIHKLSKLVRIIQRRS